MNGKYLITTDSWFFAPDGKSYRAVYGKCTIIEDSFLGLKTNRNSTNWFVRVGGEKNHVIVAGCQIHYAVQTDVEPNTNDVEEYATHEAKIVKFDRPTNIYIAK